MNRWRYFQLTGRMPLRRQAPIGAASEITPAHEEATPDTATTTGRAEERAPRALREGVHSVGTQDSPRRCPSTTSNEKAPDRL